MGYVPSLKPYKKNKNKKTMLNIKNKDQAITIKALSKKTKIDKKDFIYLLIEMGIAFIVGMEENKIEVFLEKRDEWTKETAYNKISKQLHTFWKNGKNKK